MNSLINTLWKVQANAEELRAKLVRQIEAAGSPADRKAKIVSLVWHGLKSELPNTFRCAASDNASGIVKVTGLDAQQTKFVRNFLARNVYGPLSAAGVKVEGLRAKRGTAKANRADPMAGVSKAAKDFASLAKFLKACERAWEAAHK